MPPSPPSKNKSSPFKTNSPTSPKNRPFKTTIESDNTNRGSSPPTEPPCECPPRNPAGGGGKSSKPNGAAWEEMPALPLRGCWMRWRDSGATASGGWAWATAPRRRRRRRAILTPTTLSSKEIPPAPSSAESPTCSPPPPITSPTSNPTNSPKTSTVSTKKSAPSWKTNRAASSSKVPPTFSGTSTAIWKICISSPTTFGIWA
mmetsp:Transcript_32689/g.66707  ORF Transcript_32689/g.66707 Transcript_32689/m.66707 type:complete len:203 (+) Transcript_32689:209-817(+)